MKKKLISFFLAFLVLFGLSSQISEASCYVKPTSQAKTGTLVLIKRDAETNKAIPGAYFRIFNTKGEWAYSISSNGADYDPENGYIYTTGIQHMYGIPAGSYYLKEVTAPNGYELLSEKIPFTITANKTTTLTINNKTKATTGSLDITKTDVDTGAVLSGADFTVTDSTGVSQTATTDTNGKASFSNLKAGEVTIKETKAPAGYVENTTASKATIEVNKTSSVTITNKKEQLYGSLKITKKDAADGKVLTGATFTITDSLGKSQTGTTDASGNVVFSNLATGTVTVKETKAPTGYIAVPSVPNATITANKQTTITVENSQEKQAGSLKIIKVEVGSDKVLSGAEFKITDAAGKVFTGTTDTNGVLKVTGLSVGYASIEETKAPTGYSLSKEVTRARITNNSERSVVIENSQVKLEVNAVDGDGNAVENAEFLVYSGGKTVSGFTDANGKFTTPVSAGNGYVYSLTSPDDLGYDEVNQTQVRFKIEDGETIKVVTFVFSGGGGA